MKQKTDFQTFISYFKPHRRLFFLDLACALMISLIDLAFPFVSRWCMYTLLPNSIYKTFWMVMIIFLLAYLVRSFFTYIICYYGHTFGILVEADMRKDLFEHMQSLSYGYFDKMLALSEEKDGSCVFVGRCADYILRNEPSCVSVFIHNTAENRINRIMEYDKVTEQEAKDRMASIDKSRSSYYNYYTNKAWGVASSYHLSIDASVLGIDDTVLFIKDFVMRRMEILSHQ